MIKELQEIKEMFKAEIVKTQVQSKRAGETKDKQNSHNLKEGPR